MNLNDLASSKQKVWCSDTGLMSSKRNLLYINYTGQNTNYYSVLNMTRLTDAEDEMRALRRQLKENQQGNYQEIEELGKK